MEGLNDENKSRKFTCGFETLNDKDALFIARFFLSLSSFLFLISLDWLLFSFFFLDLLFCHDPCPLEKYDQSQ